MDDEGIVEGGSNTDPKYTISKSLKINTHQYESEDIFVSMTGDNAEEMLKELNTILYNEEDRIRQSVADGLKEKRFPTTEENRKMRLTLAESEISNCKTLKELEAKEFKDWLNKVHKGLKAKDLQDTLMAHYHMRQDELKEEKDVSTNV